jgi:hypothetical protein
LGQSHPQISIQQIEESICLQNSGWKFPDEQAQTLIAPEYFARCHDDSGRFLAGIRLGTAQAEC